MRVLKIILAAAIIAAALFSCARTEENGKPLIVVSIYPYELVVKQLVGDSIRVETLIPPNASPHTYSPRPQDVKTLKQADLVLVNGFELEEALSPTLAALGEKRVSVEELLAATGTREPAGVNPHVWLSPRLLRQFVLQLNEHLQKVFPEYRDSIAKNAGTLYSQLTELDDRIGAERSAYASTPAITYHDSFHHFFTDFDIDYLGSVQESPGSEPTPRELARLGEIIQEHKVKAIYVEPQLDRRSAESLSREFVLKILELDPLGFSLQPRPKTIVELIDANWQLLRQGW